MVTKNKQRLSVSVSNETVKLIEDSLKIQKFRNKSHAVEFSINKILKEILKLNEGIKNE